MEAERQHFYLDMEIVNKKVNEMNQHMDSEIMYVEQISYSEYITIYRNEGSLNATNFPNKNKICHHYSAINEGALIKNRDIYLKTGP